LKSLSSLEGNRFIGGGKGVAFRFRRETVNQRGSFVDPGREISNHSPMKVQGKGGRLQNRGKGCGNIEHNNGTRVEPKRAEKVREVIMDVKNERREAG